MSPDYFFYNMSGEETQLLYNEYITKMEYYRLQVYYSIANFANSANLKYNQIFKYPWDTKIVEDKDKIIDMLKNFKK
jgi:hypothetical protein